MLKSRGLQPRLQRLDNEASVILKDFMYAENIDIQLTPVGIYRRNRAERAIHTFKSHFISGICTVDPNFVLKIWDKLLPQTILTLNLNINPCLSAYAQVYGVFDYKRTPLAPPGTKVLAHIRHKDCGSWAPRALQIFYAGLAIEHYGCHQICIPSSNSTCICET